MTIQTLIDCWRITHADVTFNPPGTEAEIREAEEKIGSPLPPPLREIYQFTNGEDCILGGDLRFFALLPTPSHESWVLTDVNEQYSECGWHTPQEIQIFAADGGGDPIGIWLPETDNPIFSHPIIELGSPSSGDQDGSMGVAGTNLVSFLLGLTAYHLVEDEYYYEADDPNHVKQLQTALHRLQVPEELRTEPFYANYEARFGIDYREDSVDQHFAHIRKWADPLLPDPYGDCYSQEYNVDDLKQLFGEA